MLSERQLPMQREAGTAAKTVINSLSAHERKFHKRMTFGFATPTPINQEKVLEYLSTNISEFVYDPENGITFEKWFAWYSDLFDNDARNFDNAAKVSLLLRKLDHT